MAIFLIIAVIVIILIECIPLIKEKQWAELTAVVLIMAVAGFLLISKNAGLPAPLKSMNNLFEDYGKKLFG